MKGEGQVGGRSSKAVQPNGGVALAGVGSGWRCDLESEGMGPVALGNGTSSSLSIGGSDLKRSISESAPPMHLSRFPS